MNQIETYAPGSFCWAELATSDVEAGKKFYYEMFGWAPEENPMPEGVYVIFKAGGKDAAAMYKAPEGVPPYWGIYFAVESADESAATAVKLGGKVVAGPFDVHVFGRMAVVQDPQGTNFCLWEAKEKIGATYGGPLSQVVWPELHVTDPVAAVSFYSGLFGWTVKPGMDVATAQYVEWTRDGVPFGGLMPMTGPEWKGVPPHWMIYVTVADCDERAGKVTELGGNVCVPPTDIPNTGRFAVVNDGQGATFSLIQLTRMEQPAAA